MIKDVMVWLGGVSPTKFGWRLPPSDREPYGRGAVSQSVTSSRRDLQTILTGNKILSGAVLEKNQMPEAVTSESKISRDRLAELLNEDLSREYEAIIAYVVHSQLLSGAQYMDSAAQLEIHAKQELDHALILSRQIDYLGKMPAVTPKPVRTSE
jgi:hypothetical protein